MDPIDVIIVLGMSLIILAKLALVDMTFTHTPRARFVGRSKRRLAKR